MEFSGFCVRVRCRYTKQSTIPHGRSGLQAKVAQSTARNIYTASSDVPLYLDCA